MLFNVMSAANVFSADPVRSSPAGLTGGQQSAAIAPTAWSAEDAYSRVIDLLSDGRQTLAEEYIESDVKTYPNEVRLLFALEQYEEAEHKYREAFRLKPHGRFIAQIAACWEHLGTNVHPLAKTEFIRDAQVAGYTFQTNISTNDVLKNKRRVERFEKCNTVVRGHPYDAAGYLELGHCFAGGFGTAKDADRAIACYEKAVELEPDNWNALNSLAASLVSGRMGSHIDYPRALEVANRAVQVNRNEMTLQTLAVILFESRRYEKAVEANEDLIAFWKAKYPYRDVPAQYFMSLDMAKGARDRELHGANGAE